LTEYVKEIQDPENKKRYEAEIIEMERKRGQEVKFVNPIPGFVLRVLLEPGRRKVFVNVCQSQVVAEATCKPSLKAGSKKSNGTQWNIPYSLSPGREDLDKSGKRCLVYDCSFNPKSYQKGQKYPRFMQMLVETALDALQTREEAKIASGKVKFLKIPYKGTAYPTIVRETAHKKSKKKGKSVPSEDDLPFGVVYPPLPSDKQDQPQKQNGDHSSSPSPPSSPNSPPHTPTSPTEPHYIIKYRGDVSMGDYTNDRISHAIKRPKEIVITVELLGVTSSGDVELEVLEKQLLLENKDPPYHLDVS
jgi:dynein assembly factor 2